MATDELLIEVRDGVAWLTINRPERRNALTWELMRELREALARLRDDPDARVVVVTGTGDRAFCAGADLGGMTEGSSFSELHEARGEMAEVIRSLYGAGMPTIARVQGYALAGGFGLALACDLVIASDDAVFGAPEVDIGLWPHMITVPLIRSMPPKRALELMMTGRRVPAAEGERLGFVNRVVPPHELDDAVGQLASLLAAKSPVALRHGRDGFYAVWDRDVEAGLRLLHPLLTVTASTDDAAEGVAAFREKRSARWTGR